MSHTQKRSQRDISIVIFSKKDVGLSAAKNLSLFYRGNQNALQLR